MKYLKLFALSTAIIASQAKANIPQQTWVTDAKQQSALLGASAPIPGFNDKANQFIQDNFSQDQINTVFAPGQLFAGSITVTNPNGQKSSISRSGKLQDVINEFQSSQFEHLFPGFDQKTSQMEALVFLRGIKATALASTQNNVRTLKIALSIPGEPVEVKTFTQQLNQASPEPKALMHAMSQGDNEEDVWDQLVDWLKGKQNQLGGDSNGILTKMADSWVSYTTIDPVAGNPNSMMANMAYQNYDMAADGIYDGDATGFGLLSTVPSFATSTDNDYKVSQFNLPIKYHYDMSSTDRLIVDLPLSYSRISGASTYSLALGLGYSHTFISRSNLSWALTPSIHTGAVGSMDMGSGTAIYNPALASRVVYHHQKWTYGMTNDLSYLKTMKVKIGDLETPYNIQNTMTVNGLDATYEFGPNYSLGSYLMRSDVIGGQKWYIDNYSEFGLKFSRIRYKSLSLYDHLSASLGYFFGPHSYDGVRFSGGLRF